jgi:hypothetical protein
MNYAEVLAHLEHILKDAALEDCPGIIGRLEALKVTLWARVVHPNGTMSPSAPIEKESYLTVEQVALEFHVTPKWLYRHKKDMPHSQPTRKTLLFPATKTRRWFAARKSA